MNTITRAPEMDPDTASSREPEVQVPGAGLAVESVSHSYGELRVLDGVSLAAAPREVLGIVGRSGCGKSTLLELICGLADPETGSIAVGKTNGPSRMDHCAYMPQRDLLLPWLPAIDNASLALRVKGIGKSEARAAAAPLFERFGLAGFEDSTPDQLSGGMRQRVAFLRTLLAGKPLLLLDEPFAGLDAISRAEMQEWLVGALAAEPRTVVLVTHDVEEALYLCDRVIVLSRRPAQVIAELAQPAPRSRDRLATVTSPEFVAARERALEVLR